MEEVQQASESRKASMQMRAKFRSETDFDSFSKSTFVKVSEQTQITNEFKEISYSSSKSFEDHTRLIIFLILIPVVLVAVYFANRWIKKKFNGIQSSRRIKEKIFDMKLGSEYDKINFKNESLHTSGCDDLDVEVGAKTNKRQTNYRTTYGANKLSRTLDDDDWIERNHPDHTTRRIAQVTEWLKDTSPYSQRYEESKQEEEFRGYNIDHKNDQYDFPKLSTFSKNQTYTKQNVNIFGQEEFEEEYV